MDSAENSYCRLCAELKHNNKLINLQYDDEKLREIVEKLNRVNAGTDFSEDALPKTVCLECINSLDRAFELVLNIEQAQSILGGIFFVKQIKREAQESSSSDDENYFYDASERVKNENVNVKQECEKEALKSLPKAAVKSKNKAQKKSTNIGLDTLPLSQLKLTWKDYIWTCSYCETQFSTIDELTLHAIQYHDSCNAYRCTDCNIRKLRLDSFLIHVKRHRKYLKLSCYKCHKTFSSPRRVNMHAAEHKTTKNVCNGCNTSFLTPEELENHIKTYYHVRKTRPIPELPLLDNLTCILCKKTFKHRGSLSTHLLIHTERKRDHTCDKCGKCFLNKQNLAGHMILHDNIRPYQCEICKSSFKTQSQLRNHVGVHDNRKPFACEQCGRCFRLQKQLTSHSIIHTDALPYICSYCNKRFRFKTILNQHIRQHTGVKPYSCQMCQRDFTNWPNYNKHMKRRHGMDMARKKHTPEGVYPIDPTTGEIIVHTETSKLTEWKEQMMSQRKPGRPKVNFKTEDGNTGEESHVIQVGSASQCQ